MAPTKTTKPLDEPCQAFARKLEESRLLSSEELAAAHEQLRRGRGKAHPVVVATLLVDQGVLSRWQAEQILGGRTAFRLGRYKLIEKIGAGGMGAVYKAEQMGLGRIVAVKLMGQEVLQKPGALDRFLREIQLVAKLQHPNIVAAYDADQVAGRHFLVLEYVEGQDLEQVLQQTVVLPVGVACQVIVQAATGLQHAFERGIVHRDIKPGNLLITQGADGAFVVKILDMGLARFTRDEKSASLTKSGQIMGTPDYMAPEQVEDTRKVDTRADIYSLGSSLFEMLAGRPPFEGGSSTRRLMARMAGEAPRLRSVAPTMPAALDAVIARMIARNPDDRFATPGEAAAALAPFANDKSTFSAAALRSGDRESADTRDMSADISSKALGDLAGKANQSSTSIGLQAALDKSLDEFDSLLQNIRSTSAETTLGKALVQREEEEAKDWRWRIVVAAAVVLLAACSFGWYQLGATKLTFDIPAEERTGLLQVNGQHVDFPNHGPVELFGRPGERRIKLTRAGYQPVETSIALVRGEQVVFRPDWKPLPETSRALVWTALEKEARAYANSPPLDPKLNELTNRILRERAVQSSYPESKRAYSILAKLPSPLDLYESSKIAKFAVMPQVTSAAQIVGVLGSKDSRRRFWRLCSQVVFAPDSHHVFVASFGLSRMLDLRTNRHQPFPGLAVYSCSVSSDGKMLVIGESSGAVAYDVETGDRLFSIPLSYGYSVQLSADDQRLLVGSTEGLSIWAAERSRNADSLVDFPLQMGNVLMARFSSDGTSVFSCCEGESLIRQHDATSGALIRTLEGHKGQVYEVAVSKQGMLASCGLDGTVRLWDVATGKPSHVLSAPGGTVSAIAFTPDGRRVISGDSNYRLRLWDVESGNLLQTVPGHLTDIASIAVSPDGASVATGGSDGALRTWTLQNDTLKQTGTEFVSPHLLCSAVSGDGRMIAAGTLEGDVLVWDGQSQPPRSLQGHTSRVGAIQFAPFGSLLATGSNDYQIILWDAATGEAVKTLKAHTHYVRAVAFSNDGRWLASGGSDSIIRIWNVASGEVDREFKGHESPVLGLAWRPDGKMLVSNDSAELKIWNVEQKSAILSRKYPNGIGGPISVAPDGASLIMPLSAEVRRRSFSDLQDELLTTNEYGIYATAISPGGRRFAFSDFYGELHFRKMERGSQPVSDWTLAHYYGIIKQLSYSNDGRHLLTTNSNGTAYLMRVVKEKQPAEAGVDP